jgi:protein with PEP-CTERM/exosortase system signal
MRRKLMTCGLLLGLSLLAAGEASAATFDLNDIYCNCLPAGSTTGGTVTLNDLGSDIQFIVDLNDSLNFHYTNAFDLFAFNYSGNFAESSFSISGAPAEWDLYTTPVGNASMNGAGKDYDLYVRCEDVSCSSGGGGISGVNTLTFVLHSTEGDLDLLPFETKVGDTGTNNNNFAVTATQLTVSGCTGVIGGGDGINQSAPKASTGTSSSGESCSGGTTVPDGGSTLGLLGLGMLSIAFLRRRGIVR